jgi:hypothetical protein
MLKDAQVIFGARQLKNSISLQHCWKSKLFFVFFVIFSLYIYFSKFN